MTNDIEPGLVVLHGNRLEGLRDAVLDWLARRPLEPLETEVLLVQSNGAAEWLKMALAQHAGVCAATRVELPARFLWRSYRQVLGAAAVPQRSPFDQEALVWRLMRLLPQLAGGDGGAATFLPIAGFLRPAGATADAERRLQLAVRLADLYDQYQVHRGDWLADWAEDRDELAPWRGEAMPVPPEQRWQPALWRALRAELDDAALASVRPQVHRAFLAALAGPADWPAAALPRRVTLFGAAHLPQATLQALAAIATHSQVLMAVPNPCRYHWADIIEGRERFSLPRQRLPDRKLTLHTHSTLAQVPLTAMHAHAHPLLAAWGRQGRDFMRQLDRFEDTTGAPRVDLYDEDEGTTLLSQVQAAVRDLLPLAEHPQRDVDAADRSIDFHIAHGSMREVEILHDRLLDLLAAPPGSATDSTPLNPRDIVVMVPDIETFAPAIRAVFGQIPRGDARFIPYEIADLRQREANPLLRALEWLLRIGSQRVLATDVFDLLDVPAIARRFGLQPGDLPPLRAWAADTGVRWGLHEAQRSTLGLAACGELNTWAFGLRRMLLGYASGSGPAWSGIEPQAEIGGLQAALLGGLADLVEQIAHWWALAGTEAQPAQWAQRARELLQSLVDPADERERLSLAALQTALADWLQACADAGFDEAVPVAVLREGWLGGVDAGHSSGRFLAGGVTFCTLLPLRAVPFEVVCLLGMNDADYPRPVTRNDFDLMALPGQQRPGDRSRRDDDRYLMLEALLSARRVLHLSWSGRSARDNTPQPPSVLVAQLRDYLAAGWQPAADLPLLQQLTTEHPLQPFSRRYFEAADGEANRDEAASAVPQRLHTWSREWRAVHELNQTEEVEEAASTAADTAALTVLDRAQLARFLRNPVKSYFKEQLAVVFEEGAVEESDEPFALAGLPRHRVLTDLIAEPGAEALADRLQRIGREGRLPLGTPGIAAVEALDLIAGPMLAAWQAAVQRWPDAVKAGARHFSTDGLQLKDSADALRCGDSGRVWLAMTPSKLVDDAAKKDPQPLPAKLIDAWVRMLLDAACAEPTGALLIGSDVALQLQPPDADTARTVLVALLQVWREGMLSPLPLAPKTALAWLAGRTPQMLRSVYEGGRADRGEGQEACLARLYPNLDALLTDGDFELLAERVYGPLLKWVQKAVTVLPLPQLEVQAAHD